jgi:Domain of unknown function (DUF397)
MDDVSNATWRKSSYSGGNGGDCVEVAVLSDGSRAVRDSKDPDGGALVFDTGDWLAFLRKIRG